MVQLRSPAKLVALLDLTGPGEAGGAPEERQAARVQGLLRRASVQ